MRLAYDRGVDPELLRDFRAAVDAKIVRGVSHEIETESLRAEAIARIARGVARARSKGLVSRVWLFGSFAWGTPHAGSDVDLLLEGAEDPFLAAAEIEFGSGCEVDVLRIERAPIDLRQRVLEEGRLL